jgi:hypothetical protein
LALWIYSADLMEARVSAWSSSSVKRLSPIDLTLNPYAEKLLTKANTARDIINFPYIFLLLL